ncbi:MAG: hypothetical protein IKK12_04160 [Clostridia bacterium]|nr:hypothetical protein [Clostridia bacterium]
MKKVIIAMVAMFVLIIPMGGVWGILLKPLIGGGVEQSFIYPIYAGIILLAGLVVGCTVVIIDEIRSLKDKI